MPGQPNFNSDDFYAVLGLSRGATSKEIKTAYHKLALEHHPDKHEEAKKSQAEDRFKKISEAYKVLSDPEKKSTYDKFGRSGLQGAADAAGPGMSHEDAQRLFREFFPGGGAGRARGGMRSPFDVSGGGGGAGMPGFAGMGRDAAPGMDGFDFLLGSLLGGGGMAQGMGAPRSRARQASPARPPAYAIPPGTSVVIKGLNSSKEHNGKTARVVRFHEQRNRYEVLIEGEGKLSLNPWNVTQLCEVEVFGLASKPELNGKTGDIFNFQDANDRYMILLGSPAQAIALQPGNCLLKRDTRVLLQGLANEKFNGQMACIESCDRDSGRYRVRCRSGEEISVKFDKVVC